MYLVTKVYMEYFVASLCLQEALYSTSSRRMVKQGGTSSTLGQGVVEECSGPSCSIISKRMDTHTSSVCSFRRGSCHCGSNKMQVTKKTEAENY